MPRSKLVTTEVKEAKPVIPDDVLKFVKLVGVVRTSKNDSKVNEAFAEIERMLKPRIKSLCNKFTISGCDPFDIYQEALVALRYKAIKDYDVTRGTTEGPAPFDRFALLCIRRHLSTELKTSHQMRRRVLSTCISLDQERNEYNDDLSLINIIPQTKGDVLTLVESKEYFTKLVHKLLSKLSKLEREVFMLYIEKFTYEEIAEVINRRRVKNTVKIKGVDNALSRIKTKAKSIISQKTFRRDEEDL